MWLMSGNVAYIQRETIKARFPLPELTARVNGPNWRVTGFHYPSITRFPLPPLPVLTGARFPLAELTARQLD